jgi:HAD superfamily hydrolase (TIGR01549 family)
MNKQIKVLFTSVGRRVELIQTFKRASVDSQVDIIVYGVDISDIAPALFFCDMKYKICSISDVNYIPELIKLCQTEGIDLLIPTIDTDLLLLSSNKNLFEKVGTRVLVSNADKISLCRDKRKTADFFMECGLLTPVPVDTVTSYQGGYPCFIKPLNGSSSINAFKVNDYAELRMYSQLVKNYIIQPFVEGTEYTVDIFCDFEGNPISITPRKRLAVRSGEVLKTQICYDTQIIEECSRLIDKFKPCGPLTVQLIRQKQIEKDYYIEINPRFGGGAPLSMMAGANSAEAILHLLVDDDSKKGEHPIARDSLIYCRFDQSICINDYKARDCEYDYDAVVFDLDDTLYSEKDYVMSGFIEVGKVLSEVRNVVDKLWYAFQKGEKAIEYVLRNEGIYSEYLKEICVQTYRNHIPKIKLYDGYREILESLHNSGIKLGLITDGRPDGQNNKINALGIRDVFDKIIVTDELGGTQFRKPNDISFRLMQGVLGVPYNKMVYVGDNPNKDFVAPSRLGMDSWYFKNDDGLYSYKPSSSIRLHEFQEISQLMDRLNDLIKRKLI